MENQSTTCTVVARRVKKNGSRQKQGNSHRKKLELRITTKRKHNISKIIDTNEPAAKKPGHTMVSVTIYHKKIKSSNRWL